MNKHYFTGKLKMKGWLVKDALVYWGRSYDWWRDNVKGDEFAHRRLECMIDGLPRHDICRK